MSCNDKENCENCECEQEEAEYKRYEMVNGRLVEVNGPLEKENSGCSGSCGSCGDK